MYDKRSYIAESLIIFSRYPEAGKTKTRMIPALGAAGAAQLQREMTEHTVKTARELRRSQDISVEIHFTGCDRQLMAQWLGTDLDYYSQVIGDLGEKMRSAFARGFKNNYQRIVTIGIDCPDINVSILNEAFNAIKKQDLVLGAAEDGGYYLIGLNGLIPELFENINWGTSEVFHHTKTIAEQLNLNVHYLPILRDIDRPEDLSIWQKYQSQEK